MCSRKLLLNFFRLLESQLQSQKKSHENELESLRGEIQGLKEENNRQQQLLAQNLQLPPEARIEASLQHEITRLTNENLVRETMLQEQAGGPTDLLHLQGLSSFQMATSCKKLQECGVLLVGKLMGVREL